MKLAILTKDQNLASNIRFQSEAKQLGIEVEFINPFKTVIDLDLRLEYDAILNRMTLVQRDPIVEQFLQIAKVKLLVNSLSSWQLSQDKFLQMNQLKINGLCELPTLTYRGEDASSVLEAVSSWKTQYGPGVVSKTIFGNQGRGVELHVDSKALQDKLLSHLNQNDQVYLFQPLIKVKREIRIFYLSGELICLTRTGAGFKANFYQGGEAQIFKNTIELEKIAEEITQAFGLTYFSADVLDDGEKLSVIDVNSVPGFEQLEKVSGKNIAKGILELFARS